jgi:addiction module RelE/StbE family toxin
MRSEKRMLLALEWTSQAEGDLLAIVAYIAEENPDAAQALKDEIEAKSGRLPQHPKLYKPGRVKGTREMVTRPNYVVIYRETRTEVTILRVLHAARQWP